MPETDHAGQPIDPDTLDAGLNHTLSLATTEAGADRVVMTFTIDDRHLQPQGIVHGGVYCAVVEGCASVGAAMWLGERGQVVGVSNHTDFLRSVRAGSSLRAVGTPIHRGRSQQLWLVEIHDCEQRLIARGQVRLQNLTG